MQALMRHVGRWLLMGALFASVGGHLALVQTVAWGAMMVSYSKNASLSEAARKTFDGDHPCRMCKLVEESREKEDQKPQVKTDTKLDILLPAAARLKEPVGTDHTVELPEADGSFSEVCPVVPHRPPRLV